LGVTLYEALTGRLPYGGATVMQLLRTILGQDAPPVQRLAEVPNELAAVIHRLLSRKPEERFPSGRAASRALMDATPERAAVETRLSMRLLSSAFSPSGKATLGDIAAAL
jgi:serine/threonine protein kinase